MKQLSDYFPDLIFDSQLELNFEAVPHISGHAYGAHPIIYMNQEDKKLHCKLMEWGCIPFYIKDESAFAKQRANMLNARSERILDDTKSYWNKIRNRRCLIPVSGIYEHRKIKTWKKKVPYLVQLKDQEMFFLPGLYSVTELPDKDGVLNKVFTFTMVTRSANALMSKIHNDGANLFRMPLFLSFELSGNWLKEDLSEKEYREILAFEMPDKNLNYHPVFTVRTTKDRPDNKPITEQYEWEGLPELGNDEPQIKNRY